ncbi:MAG TPA: hypothetical protein VK363_16415 [Pyrinomonadaceae bacterium]|nr:hypothetical protein [Pyrinomonadaceae bacterium]
MRKLANLLVVLFVCACCFNSSEARAQDDPIIITSGSLTARGQLGSYNFSIAGEDFAFNSYWEGSGIRIACIPCLVERRLKAVSTMHGSYNTASAVLEGRSYSGIGANWDFSFFLDPVVLPDVRHDLVITTPFVMTGNYNATERRPLPGDRYYDATFYRTKLAGRGNATHRFRYGGSLLNGRPFFSFVDVTYNFAPATARKKGGTLRSSDASGAKSVVSAPSAGKPQK